MEKKNRIRTNNLRTIKKYAPRFISLIIMSMLGVLVYVGLSSTSPDMLYTLDKYLDDNNVYDIKVISTLGLTSEDIDDLSKVDGVLDIQGTKNVDVIVSKEDKEFVLDVASMPDKINKLELIDGRYPENSNEIVVEKNLLSKEGYQLGDKIIITSDNLKNEEYVIVGVVRSPLYYSNTDIHQNRGTTSVGTGTINYYSYVLEDSIDMDYYTNIYMTVDNAIDEVTSKDSYKRVVNEVVDEIDKIKSNQEEKRYLGIHDEALEEIEKNEDKLNKELSKAKKELDNANKELNSGWNTLESTRKQLSASKNKLDSAKIELDKGEKELNKALKQYNIQNINSSLNTVNKGISDIEKQLSMVKDESLRKQLSAQLVELKKQQGMLVQLSNTKKTLDDSRNAYNSGLNKYNEGYKAYNSALKIYNDNNKKYNDGLAEYNDNKDKYSKEIEDAKIELGKIKKPQWYIYDRDNESIYASYIDQVASIKNLALVFPLVFYAVAILISLISMNRMVEDDRGEIGTLKSLGFTNREIKSKYVVFSLFATIIGSLIGSIVGLIAIPYIIFTIYRLLFDVPNFQFGLNLDSTLVGVIIAIICIVGASIITANKVLKEKPSELMRPKPPKTGKKILLERFKWLWNNIKFSNKVTIRNIFRYKKRVIITIVGIVGCTALMLCGFGIKDSIVDITTMQYDKTFKYDKTIYMDDLSHEEIAELMNDDAVVKYTVTETLTGTLNDSNISMIIYEDNNINEFIEFVDRDNEKIEVLGNDEVIITDKIADIYDINIGDTINILDNDKRKFSFKVSNIVKNYMGHYVYVNKDVLDSIEEIEYSPNVVYLNVNELSDEEDKKLTNKLMENDKVINVIDTSLQINSVQDMLSALDKVVVILVLLSAMLSFVVLYNLANININERKREISTLKVLGFYDNEVDSYITKEMIILTIVGISLGLVLGYFLTSIVIGTVEMENARFIRHIKLNSYIYAACISGLFTFIVNFVTHFILKRINMIESLKSVE